MFSVHVLLLWCLVRGQPAGIYAVPDDGPTDYGMPVEEVKNRLTEWFTRVDTDKNGKLNRTEAESWLQDSMINIYAMQSKDFFEELDQDKNGKLNREEFTNLDEDEKVDKPFTREEWQEALGKKFDLADLNSDKFLNHIEFAYLTNPSLLPELLQFEITLLYKGQDKDQDGKISLAEYLEQVDQVREEMEANMDMENISEETLNEFKEQMAEHFHEIDRDDSGYLEAEDLRVYFSDSLNTNETLSHVFETSDMDIPLETLLEDPEKYVFALIDIDILKYPSQYFFEPPFEFEDIGEIPQSGSNLSEQFGSILKDFNDQEEEAPPSQDKDFPTDSSGDRWDEL